MMLKEIVFDTETTGMDPLKGDRVVEIGCVELENLVPTGRTFHMYLNPEREIPAEAIAVHGITNDFVKDKPLFVDVAADFMEFVGESVLVAHNAGFDMKFINWELGQCGYKPIDNARVVDTLLIARKQAPGAPASLDALCKRFNIDNSNRKFHGALLDAQLLAEVYLELRGGRQQGLSLGDTLSEADLAAMAKRKQRPARAFPLPAADLAAHAEFLKQLKDPLWDKLSG